MAYLIFSLLVDGPVSTDLLYIDAAAVAGTVAVWFFVRWDERRLNRLYRLHRR